MHLEVRLGRRLGTVRAVAVVDAVEVQVEDLLLRIAALHLLCEHELVELSADRPRLSFLGVEHVVLHDLLRDRRPAERGRVMREVVSDRDQCRPRQPPPGYMPGPTPCARAGTTLLLERTC